MVEIGDRSIQNRDTELKCVNDCTFEWLHIATGRYTVVSHGGDHVPNSADGCNDQI